MISTASLLLTALSLQGVSANADSVPGGYAARGEDGACRVMLMSPATRPAESLLAVNAVSGLAAVAPDCPLALRDAGLWTLLEAEGQLVLTGHGGERLWTGVPAGDGRWTGSDEAGEPIVLART